MNGCAPTTCQQAEVNPFHTYLRSAPLNFNVSIVHKKRIKIMFTTLAFTEHNRFVKLIKMTNSPKSFLLN